MKISKSFEQSIYVLLLLATQTDHQPVKSATLSSLLHVSDSSLKKILRKLVIQELITSNASKDGGFTLNKPIAEISLLDVLQAVELEPLIEYKISHLGRSLFPHKEHTIQGEQLVHETLSLAEQAFANQLKTLSLDQLLEADSIEFGAINWEQR